MKKYKMLKKVTFCSSLLLASTLTSCTDWLTLYPMDKIVEENFWEDKRDLESVRNAVYVNMTTNDCLERYMVWGELRSDNLMENSAVGLFDNLRDISEKVDIKPQNPYASWSKFYESINYCNKVLQHGPEILQKDKSFSTVEWEYMKAEMVALRALNYFYLIRAFDEVPMVFTAINDDSEVRTQKAVPQSVLLDSLVNQMEYVVEHGQICPNYGNSADNKGLITDKAFHTILADLYLWRGSYYEGIKDKTMADSSYKACIAHCEKVIDLFDKDYRNLSSMSLSQFGADETERAENKYHLIWNTGNDRSGLESNAYNSIFGSGNSFESIFELQFNGNDVTNALVGVYYRNSNGAGSLLPSKIAKAQPAGVDAENALFSKTDLRRWATVENQKAQDYYIIKYAAGSIEQPSVSDNTKVSEDDMKPEYSLRSTANAHWIFYRLPDVLLMKAEAMCLLKQDAKQINELLNAVFKRSNPKALSTELLPVLNYGDNDANDNIQKQILRERNREFYGEGKRWFDIMRYALRKGYAEGPSAAYSLFKAKYEETQNAGSIEGKYKQNMKVMYFPYSETEVKANPELVQNPIWNDQSTIQKK